MPRSSESFDSDGIICCIEQSRGRFPLKSRSHHEMFQWITKPLTGLWLRILPRGVTHVIQLYRLYHFALDDMSDKRELTASYNGKPTVFAFNAGAFVVSHIGSTGKPTYETSPYHVLWVECTEGNLELCFLVRKSKAARLSLVHIVAKVKDAGGREWSEALMEAAYSGLKPKRKLKVFVNPNSGPGKAPVLFKKTVEPILRSAQCIFDVVYTTHSKHAQEISKELPLDYDAVVIVSGDGLAHEIFNGFAEHSNPMQAFSIPLAPIPSGSGNGTCLSLLGLKDGSDVAAATLNAIKGRPMKVDLCSVTQKDKRFFSYMSQATGLMADLDIGTEHLRWMGDARFPYGFLRGVLNPKACPISVSVKIANRDKHGMVKEYRSALDSRSSGSAIPQTEAPPESNSLSLPPLKYSKEDKDGWVHVDAPLLFLYAGKSPFASRDLLQWPLAQPNDGLIDLVLQEVTSRRTLLGAIAGADKGDAFWLKSLNYIKAEAYRVKVEPCGSGYLSIDGEAVPFEDYELEVHQGLATFLSPLGHYAFDFQSPPPAKK